MGRPLDLIGTDTPPGQRVVPLYELAGLLNNSKMADALRLQRVAGGQYAPGADIAAHTALRDIHSRAGRLHRTEAEKAEQVRATRIREARRQGPAIEDV